MKYYLDSMVTEDEYFDMCLKFSDYEEEVYLNAQSDPVNADVYNPTEEDYEVWLNEKRNEAKFLYGVEE